MILSSVGSSFARGIAAALLVACVALAGGCASLGMGAGSTGSASPVLDRVLESGELRIGISGDAPPMNATHRNGELMGFEVDLAISLAMAIGVEAVPVKLPFGDLLAALEDGRVDIVMSNMTMTTERNAKVAFVGPYLVSGKALLTSSQALAVADEMEDLDREDLQISALRGSTSEQLLRRVADDATLHVTDTPAEAVQLVIDGKVQAMLADYPIVVLAVLRNPDAGLIGIGATLTFEPIGAALPADDALFMNLVRNYLTLVEGTGSLDLLRLKWFGNASWLENLADGQ